MIINRLINRARGIRQRGLMHSLRIALDKAGLSMLRLYFGFNSWHVDAPLSARPYRRVVAEIVNDLKPGCVVEVGCGLGAILSLVIAKSRYGFDLDAGAIRAARFLRSQDIGFVNGGLEDVKIPQIDVLILVNWIHEVSPQQLSSWLFPLLPRIRFLLLDAIDQDNPLDYLFKHDFVFLSGQAVLVKVVRPSGEGRRFMLFQVNS